MKLLFAICFVCFITPVFSDEPPLPQNLITQIEKHLKEQYGTKEVAYFRGMLNSFYEADAELSQHDDETLEATLKTHMGQTFVDELHKLLETPSALGETKVIQNVIKMIKQQFNKLRHLENQYVKPNWSHFQQIQSMSKSLPIISGDTPCKDDAGCKRIEVLVNRCNFARQGATFAYNIFQTFTHVVNTMISLLCGCLFIGPVHLCVLKNFPYTCSYPYPVFQSLYMATSAVWETVKATSTLCRVYGDPGIASVVG